MHRRFHFASSVLLFGLALAASALWRGDTFAAVGVPHGTQPPQAQTNVYGWAWSGTDDTKNVGYGWFSANCYNIYSGKFENSPCTRSSYGLKMELDGDLVGYMWNDAVGWIDFAPTGPYPAYPQHSARFFAQDTPADPDDPYDNVEDPRNPDAAGYEAGQVAGWARITTLHDYGFQTYNQDDWGWIQLRGKWATEDVSDPYAKGVWIDFDTGQMYGWAWSGVMEGDDIGVQGIGWIEFRNSEQAPRAPFAPIVQAPFIEVKDGNIYGQESIGIDRVQNNRQSFAPPKDNFNATYLIQSGGEIQHFVSQELNRGEGSLEPGDYTMPNSEFGDTVTLPQAGNRYQNVLGRLDLPGIRTIVDVATGKNKYGHEIVESSEIKTSSIFSNQTVLGGKIYVITPGNLEKKLTVDDTLRIKNGAGVNSGAGLIIVDGDLNITEAVRYTGKPPVNALGHIASLAWIVLGDITIQGAMTDLDGAYIALGRSDASGGLISTGAANTQLRVSGLLMAKSFQFQRTYIGEEDKKFKEPQSSEQVKYDGRLHVNVPPGLEDFSAAFPIQRATLP